MFMYNLVFGFLDCKREDNILYSHKQIYPEFELLKTKRRPLYLKAQSVPRCKHFISWL